MILLKMSIDDDAFGSEIKIELEDTIVSANTHPVDRANQVHHALNQLLGKVSRAYSGAVRE